MKTEFFLSKTEYHASFPVFKFNSDLAIGDLNLAAQILLHSTPRKDFERSMQRMFEDLQLKHEGASLVTDNTISHIEKLMEAFVETQDIHLRSHEFGEIDLQLTLFSLPDPNSDELFDRTVYAEIKKIEHEEMYRHKLQIVLQHQLIWGTYAISYDLILPELDFYREVVNRHSIALAATGINRVLDIGAGTGNVTRPLLQGGHYVTAIDVSRPMLDKLRTKLSEQDNLRVTILQQDAADLSAFGDASFDSVNILLALFDMHNPTAALNEAIRVLRPGGTIIVTEPKRVFNLQALLSHAEKNLRDKGIYNKLIPHWVRVSEVNKKIDPSKREALLFVEDIKEILDKSGFNIQRMEDSHYGNCTTILAIKTR
jgi:ubiquinone/menaquinone biosynthesis C-methylase UbiE